MMSLYVEVATDLLLDNDLGQILSLLMFGAIVVFLLLIIKKR